KAGVQVLAVGPGGAEHGAKPAVTDGEIVRQRIQDRQSLPRIVTYRDIRARLRVFRQLLLLAPHLQLILLDKAIVLTAVVVGALSFRAVWGIEIAAEDSIHVPERNRLVILIGNRF